MAGAALIVHQPYGRSIMTYEVGLGADCPMISMT